MKVKITVFAKTIIYKKHIERQILGDPFLANFVFLSLFRLTESKCVPYPEVAYDKSVLRIHEIWYGSGCGFGSAEPYLWLMDPDSDSDPDAIRSSCYFSKRSSRCQQKIRVFKKKFFLLTVLPYFLKVHLHHFSKIKSQRSPKTEGINVFLTIFAWW